MKTLLGTAVFTGFLLTAAQLGLADPNWTKTGDCVSCHSAVRPGSLQVTNFYTRANPVEAPGIPDGGRRKVFWAKPGETKSLYAEIIDLLPDAHYSVMIKQFGEKGVQTGTNTLGFSADCGWASWWNATTGFYTDPPRTSHPFLHYEWPTGPTSFDYAIRVNTTCPSDYYDLVFAVAGAPKTGTEFFYDEQHFYLYVGAAPPPIVSAADFDCDGDVDGSDFGMFAGCFNGDGNPVSAACRDMDLTGDGDVDGADFGIFATCFNGSSNPPNGCPQ